MAKTTCAWTVERLPWWVNGTLEEAEAERVEAHLAECSACRDELAATRGALALYSLHLPIETLIELVESEALGGEAAGGEATPSHRTADGALLSREAVNDHLGHCPACREELALLRESHAAVEGDAAAPGGTVAPFAPRPAEPVPRSPRRRQRRLDRRGLDRRRLDRRALALAASSLLFVVAAGGWLASGLTAERRGDRIAELERRLTEAMAVRPEPEPGAEPSATEGTPGEAPPPAAGAEQAAEQVAARIAELEAENDRLRRSAQGGVRALKVGVGTIEPWNVQPTVLRGGQEQVAAPPIEAAADTEQISFYLVGIPDRPLRLVVEDAADGRRLVEDRRLTPRNDPELGRYASFTLPVAELPAGDVRLRLFAGGEEIGSRLLRVTR